MKRSINKDIYYDCVKDFNVFIAKLMKINGKIRRMNPTMILGFNIRKFNQMELICERRKSLCSKSGTGTKQGWEYRSIPEKNQVIYYTMYI